MSKITTKILAQSSTAWNGSALPAYPAGAPYVTILRICFAPGAVTDEHFHSIINCGVVVSGELTVVNADGTERTFCAGEAIIETVGTVHHGENRGSEPVELIMFYAGTEDSHLSIPLK